MLNKLTYARLNIVFATGLIKHGNYDGPPRIGSLDWGNRRDAIGERELRLMSHETTKPGIPAAEAGKTVRFAALKMRH